MRLTIAGHELAVDVVGHGPVLLLLHPFPFSRGLWADDAAALSVGCRVVTVDLRGFGDSAPADGAFSIADLADDAAALLDALDVSRATVGGMSMGGYVALAMAARHPQRLDGLVLADTRAAADSPEVRDTRERAIAVVRRGGVERYIESMLPRLLSRGADAVLRARVRALVTHRPETVALALEALRDRPDRTADLAAIRCPTLVLVGAEDEVTPPAEARVMAAAIPGAELVEIPGAGHLANLDAPAPFRAALGRFVAALASTPAPTS